MKSTDLPLAHPPQTRSLPKTPSYDAVPAYSLHAITGHPDISLSTQATVPSYNHGWQWITQQVTETCLTC